MDESVSKLTAWPTPSFFEKGAFLALNDEEILMGAEGEIHEASHPLDVKDAFFLKDFFFSNYLIYTPKIWLKIKKSDFLSELNKLDLQRSQIIEEQNYDSVYSLDFLSLQKSFNDSLKKVVLISREEYKVSHPLSCKFNLIKKALEFNVGTPFGFWNKQYGIIGSTPEKLYSVTNTKLSTFALAGTSKQGLEEELLRSEKDRLEHNLVVNDIKETITPFSKEVSIGETYTSNFKTLIHLKTDIQACLNEEANILDMTSKLSPTAALGGYPRAEGLSFLKSTEYFKKFPKRYFGSCLGVLTDQVKEALVTIRSVQWQGDLFIIESGGGVLPASILENELKEIHLKRETIKGHYL